jgi:excisionase family DNA binding protein
MSKALPANPMPASGRGCMSIDAVAEYLGVVPMTVRRLIDAKKLRASHVGRRVIIRAADVEKYLDANSTVQS